MRLNRLLFGLVMAAAAAPGGVGGAAPDPVPPARLAAAVGAHDAIRPEDGAVDFRLEYRMRRAIGIVSPWIGLEATSLGAIYGAGGVLIDFDIGLRWIVTGSLGVGAYRDGRGKDLGYPVEFRTQVELARRLGEHARLALAFGHISNASLGDSNPGVEIVSLYYSIPISRPPRPGRSAPAGSR